MLLNDLLTKHKTYDSFRFVKRGKLKRWNGSSWDEIAPKYVVGLEFIGTITPEEVKPGKHVIIKSDKCLDSDALEDGDCIINLGTNQYYILKKGESK